MSRLQTKCVFGSLFFHGGLILLLVIGSAFVNPKPKEQAVKFATIFNAAEITDSETQGGGNPNAPVIDPGPPAQAPGPIEPAPAPVQTPAAPVVAPPQPVEQTPKAVVRPPDEKPKTPVKPLKKDPIKKPREEDQEKTAKKPIEVADKKKDPTPVKPSEKPKIQVDLTTTKVAKADNDWQQRKTEQAKKIEQQRKAAEEARRQAQIAQDKADRAAAEEYAEAHQNYLTAVANANRQSRELAAQRADLLAGAASALRNGLSASSVIEMPGPGGKAFINYTEFIFTRYYEAWQTPSSTSATDSVKVEIVVARSGKVISSRIIDKSGDAALDRSVREALSRVQNLPAFPAGTADETRTFKINFTLEAKRTLG